MFHIFLFFPFSYFNKYDTNQFGAIFWFMLFRLSEDYSDALHGIAQREGRLDIPGKSFFIKGIGTILMFFWGYHITGKLDSTLAIVALTSCAITATFDLLNVKKLACFSLYDRFQRCFALGKETVPLCLYMFLLSAISAVPKYILEKMCDTLALGAYSPFVTMFAEYYNKGERKCFVRLAQKLCAVVFGIAIVILAFGKLAGSHVLKMMFGEEILDYSGLLFPILLSTFLTSYLAFFCMMEVVVRDFRGMVAGCMIGLILCSALTPVLIKSVGLNGTSYGMIGGTVGAIVCLSFRLKKKLRKTNKERREG